MDRMVMPPVRDIPRWFLLGVLIYAPWAYGSTRPWTLDVLRILLLVLAVVFVLSLVIDRRLPHIPRMAAGLVIGLLGLGWWMTFNARAAFDPVGPQFHEIGAFVSWLPGAMDQKRSLSSMLLVTGMMGAFVTAADMLASAKWRNRLWLAVALIGLSLVVFGVIQRVSGAKSIFWVWGDRTGSTFFATFRYHANAGAFMNLVIPFILGRTLWVLRQDAGQISKAFWCLASFIAVAAAFMNISRAAMAITVALLGVFALWCMVVERQGSRHESRHRFWWLKGLGILLAIAVLSCAFGMDQSLAKWLSPSRNDTLVSNLRYQVYDIIWQKTLPFVGWGGSGPGTFEMVFPLSIKEAGNDAVGRWYWVNAHQDYLQTLTEWGVPGGILWGGLILGGLGGGIWRLLKRRSQGRSETRYLLLAGCLALLGVSLHALADFPLQIGSLQLYAAMACAVAWTVGNEDGDVSIRRKRRRATPQEREEPA